MYIAPEQGRQERSRSAWWAELALGTVCSGTAAGFALAHTAFGPFSDVVITYPVVVSVAYLAFASLLGLVFLRTGFEHAPWRGDEAGVEPAGPPRTDGGTVRGSQSTHRTSDRPRERDGDR